MEDHVLSDILPAFFPVEIAASLSTPGAELSGAIDASATFRIDVRNGRSKGSRREEKHTVMRGEIVGRSADRSFSHRTSDDIGPDRDRRSIDQPIATISNRDRRNGFYQRCLKSNLPIVRVILRFAFSFG